MASRSSKKAPSKVENQDVMLVCARSEDGNAYGVLRQRGNEVEAGLVRPLDEGKPIHGEVVRLRPRSESSALFDVEVHHDARPSTGRPARVSNDRYRKGWESIWAGKRPDRTLN